MAPARAVSAVADSPRVRPCELGRTRPPALPPAAELARIGIDHRSIVAGVSNRASAARLERMPKKPPPPAGPRPSDADVRTLKT